MTSSLVELRLGSIVQGDSPLVTEPIATLSLTIACHSASYFKSVHSKTFICSFAQDFGGVMGNTHIHTMGIRDVLMKKKLLFFWIRGGGRVLPKFFVTFS